MSLWASLDQYLRASASPTIVIIGMVGLLTMWLVSPIARHLVEGFFGAKRREFSDQFRSVEQTRARNLFRWNIERAFKQYNAASEPGDLPRLLRQLEWPADFPPTGNIREYASALEFNGDPEIVWIFVQKAIHDSLYPHKAGLDQTTLDNMVAGWLVAAKFWDDWARQLSDGYIIPSDMEKPVRANLCDIRAIALFDMALAKTFGWDEGQGKTALYALAKDGIAIGGKSLVARWRGRLAALLRSGAKRLGGAETF